MNDDVSKSFCCNETGCQMNFYTEQSLSFHRQVKHTKLNLEIPSKDAAGNFSDQTPTPTKLLNKCEELRVFDDPYIQSLNPFEEGFRRAISGDYSTAGFLTTPSSNQDTLHTPKIIPDFIARVKEESLNLSKHDVGLLPMQEEPENLSTTPEIPKYSSIHDHHEHYTLDSKIHQQVPLLPKPNILYAAPILTNTATMHLNNSILDNERRVNESVKDKLKNIILSNNLTGHTAFHDEGIKRRRIDSDPRLNIPAIFIQTVPFITPANLVVSESSLSNSNSNTNNNNNNNNNNININLNNSNIKNNDNDDKIIESSKLRIPSPIEAFKLKPFEIKQPDSDSSTKMRPTTIDTSDSNSNNNTNINFKTDSVALKVERNRAAARRYRNKMKIQGQALREKYEKSQKEIAQLKKEVTELKKLLLLHKDCEVTKKLSLLD